MRENGKCRWRGNEGAELSIYGGEAATKQGTEMENGDVELVNDGAELVNRGG